jgi:hypothetical protein
VSNLQHAVAFLQTAYTIVLALALGEAFKEFVVSDRDIEWNRLAPLAGVLFMIFPFFHGMSRYLYTTYLAAAPAPEKFGKFLMTDGIAFMLLSACFFVISRSFDSDRWRRYYGALACLLVVDSLWIGFAVWRSAPVMTWLYLNLVLAGVLALAFITWRTDRSALWPTRISAIATFCTTSLSYWLMADFYFP